MNCVKQLSLDVSNIMPRPKQLPPAAAAAAEQELHKNHTTPPTTHSEPPI